MGRIKSIMAYTNPFAYAFGIPFLLGIVLGVFGYRIGKDVKTATKMLHDTIEEE